MNPFRTDLAGQGAYAVVDGHVEPRDAPGFGLEIDEGVLEAHPAVAGPCYIPGR